MNKNKLFKKLPFVFVSITLIAGWFLAIRGIVKYIMLYTTPIDEIPLKIWGIGNPLTPSFFELGIATIVLITGWSLATRVSAYQHSFYRFTFIMVMLIGVFFQYIWICTAPIYNKLVPFLIEQVNLIDPRYQRFKDLMVGEINGLLYLLMALPLIVGILVILWLGNIYTQYQAETNEFIRSWQLNLPRFRRFFDLQETSGEPDVDLGPNIKTKEIVRIRGADRPLNNSIIGPIGSGKTSALVLPMINQDLHHMSKMINGFSEAFEKGNFHTEDVKGKFLNGITIIEPSNDLCKKAYQLTKAHDIPEEAVFYIDPTNPNTKSINPLLGPVHKVAETFTMVIEGIGEQTDFFFEQSQRVHLKLYIYLLKLHDLDFIPTFDDLIDMYNNPQVVHHMHVKLKKQIPNDINSIQNKDERNHWKIVKGIDEWFDKSLALAEERRGSVSVKKLIEDRNSPYFNEPMYYDAKAETVVGLRNILNDISSNILVRRVLFGHSDFDFDAHLECGGILLVNSAKGELANLSETVGRFVLLSLQNAIFRREPEISPYHSVYIDEFPEYIYEDFISFPSQSRKYKAIVTIVAQTVAQLSLKYSDDYLQTLLATCRHKFVYGGIAQKDAELFSNIFGEEEKYEESLSEQTVSSMLEGTTKRDGSTLTKKKDVIMRPSDLIFQPRFVCAVKVVDENSEIQVQQINANFVPKEEFKRAEDKHLVDSVKGNYWLEQRDEFIKKYRLENNFGQLDDESEEVVTPDLVDENEKEELLQLQRSTARPREMISNGDSDYIEPEEIAPQIVTENIVKKNEHNSLKQVEDQENYIESEKSLELSNNNTPSKGFTDDFIDNELLLADDLFGKTNVNDEKSGRVISNPNPEFEKEIDEVLKKLN
ncbi:TraM recognition domain-containing protein [Bacillus sp. SM2101]|uniref:type IV secretory system conjugative DNA transfer family protein n=1 Tax=Bacillus sp. SM2101 TaxID=2805366 RepID=UPI001BDEA3F7|nr:TraM recognition domain-containing protein [Bacillus sp. SM2101]